MHEISLVRNIFNTLNAQFAPKEVSQIKTIRLKAGKLSNIEPILMQNAFEAVVATDSPEFKNAVLDIEVIPVVIECLKCGHQSEIVNYSFACQHCQTPCNNIIKGDELLISGVDMDEEK